MTIDHVAHNREFWDEDADDYQEAHAAHLDPDRPMGWGVWHILETELQVLGEVRGLDVLELGCGAAQCSIRLTRAGARPVGLDLSAGQLRHAGSLLERTGAPVPLVQASAVHVPFADANFDVVFCDHGAMSFCDPALTVPEVARLLRPGGLLAFSSGTPLVYCCYDPDDDRQTRKLRSPMFGRREWDCGDGTVDFAISHGEWIALFRRHGFVIEDLLELQAPEDATTTYEFVPYDWARRWPAEQIWRVRKAEP